MVNRRTRLHSKDMDVNSNALNILFDLAVVEASTNR